jgi:hypothetical protein
MPRRAQAGSPSPEKSLLLATAGRRGSNDAAGARYAGLDELSDSQLLAAIEGRYDVFVTLDRNIPFQQDLSGRSFAAARPGSDAVGISEPDASAMDAISAVGPVEMRQVP